MTDNPIERLMREFQEFHERIFELACRKSKYAAKMSDSLNKAIENALEEEYKTYYDLYREKLDAAVDIELYALKAKRSIMVPRHYRHWWSFWKEHTNQAADLADDRIAQDAHLYFKELMEHLETMKMDFKEQNGAALDGADQETGTATGIPEPSEPELKLEPEPDANDVQTAEPSEPETESEPEPDAPPVEEWEEENADAIPDENSTGAA